MWPGLFAINIRVRVGENWVRVHFITFTYHMEELGLRVVGLIKQ